MHPGSGVTGVILAGGRATRLGGGPKGLLRVGGRRLVDRVADALRAVTADLVVVANDPAAPGWLPGVRVVGDVVRDAGSLGGLHAALHHVGGPVLVVAWDMPFVSSALLGRLASLGTGTVEAVVPWGPSRHGVEPLCAWYAPSCLPAIERAVSAGTLAAAAFLPDVLAVVVPEAEVRAFGDPGRLFLNVNTPGALANAEAIAAGGTGDPRDGA